MEAYFVTDGGSTKSDAAKMFSVVGRLYCEQTCLCKMTFILMLTFIRTAAVPDSSECFCWHRGLFGKDVHACAIPLALAGHVTQVHRVRPHGLHRLLHGHLGRVRGRHSVLQDSAAGQALHQRLLRRGQRLHGRVHGAGPHPGRHTPEHEPAQEVGRAGVVYRWSIVSSAICPHTSCSHESRLSTVCPRLT